jgi:glycogen debranching enzyme
MHAIPLTKKTDTVSRGDQEPLIGFVSLLPLESADPEIKSAFAQLNEFKQYTAQFLTTKELEKQSKKINRFSIIWIHRPDSIPFSDLETNPKMVRLLKSYIENGGKLLLSQQAVHYLNILGFEPKKLQDSTKRCTDDGYGRRLGFHAFREHPLFEGLNGGAYLCRPSIDMTARIAGFFGNDHPEKAKVVAVDWDYIFLREDSKLVLEYSPGQGKVLAVGGYMNFSVPNTNRAHLNLFTENCLNYLTDHDKEMPEYYWDYTPRLVTACPSRPETDQPLLAIPPAVAWAERPGEIDLKRPFASDNFWDVAGERLLTMGTEKGGLEEVWAHPFMAFRDYEVGVRFAYKDTIFWLNDERPEVQVNPGFFSRQYKFPRAYLKELIINDPAEPNGVIHYEYRGVYTAELIIRFKSNLRWMWPYSDRVTGSICHSWNSDVNAITIRDQSGDLNMMIGGSKKPVVHLSGQFDGFNYIRKDSAFTGIATDKLQAAGMFCYKLDMNDNLDIGFSASSEGYDSTFANFNKTIHNPGQVYRNSLEHANKILSKSLMITTPDKDFNTGYRWALLSTDRFFVNTPGMGKALVAGYSTTRHGWDGGHKVNGRPGYGWYFGRDAEWSSFALLDYGDFEKVKSQLEFFNKFQDLNGKIFHEASTSGMIHYDAADATPLYIVLAGKYFRHTNDTAFLRKTWPNVKRAIQFCFSTDTDQDHLIENTNVGHGWVEGGELYGSHATIYMAGAWGAAMNEAANMARFMKDVESESYHLEAGEQQKIINNSFWSDQQQFFSYGMNKDGTFRHEQTILPTVPIYFRMADREKSSLALKNIAGNAFTTNWGARILREDSPWFKPTGYHYGSVWPLFTGWASLAEYATGNSTQGFSLLMNNLNVYKHWGLGFVEEVLNGAEYKPSGVCAHQCWSETMVLQPAIEGMLGLEIKAQERKIILAPQFPPQWDSVNIQHIRMADQTVDLQYTRSSEISKFQFDLDHGGSVRIDFMPSFPAGTLFNKVTLDGKVVNFTSFKSAESMTLMVSFELRNTSKLIIETKAGIAVLPAVSDPKPGDAAEGMRIISTRLSENSYQVEVEGKSGSTAILEIWSGGQDLKKAENARFLNLLGSVYRYHVDFEEGDAKYVTKVVRVVAAQPVD